MNINVNIEQAILVVKLTLQHQFSMCCLSHKNPSVASSLNVARTFNELIIGLVASFGIVHTFIANSCFNNQKEQIFLIQHNITIIYCFEFTSHLQICHKYLYGFHTSIENKNETRRSVKLLNNLNRFEIEIEIRVSSCDFSQRILSDKTYFTHATCEKIYISRVCIYFCYTPFNSQPNPD